MKAIRKLQTDHGKSVDTFQRDKKKKNHKKLP